MWHPWGLAAPPPPSAAGALQGVGGAWPGRASWALTRDVDFILWLLEDSQHRREWGSEKTPVAGTLRRAEDLHGLPGTQGQREIWEVDAERSGGQWAEEGGREGGMRPVSRLHAPQCSVYARQQPDSWGSCPGAGPQPVVLEMGCGERVEGKK